MVEINFFVLQFFCLQIIRICLSRTVFLGQKDIRTKGDMEIECLIEINLMFFCLQIIKTCPSRTVFFGTEGHKDKRGYGNGMFGRNKSYVLLFLCLQIIKTCPSRTVFWT